jgi:tetratricopeptide (TPR) repeat protein
MAPEQARGETSRIDSRSDVFGLGAMLCQILTGQPAFAGSSAEAISRAKAGDLTDAFARLDGCGADAELIALAKRCLASDPENRPVDAGVLAAELTGYLESVEARMRQAELDRAGAELKATEERKRRKIQVGLVAAVMLLLVGGGGAVWLWQATNASLQPRLESVRRLQEEARKDPLGGPRLFLEAAAAARNVEELAGRSAASFRLRREAAALAEVLEEEAAAAGLDQRLVLALWEVHAPRDGPLFRRDNKGGLVELARLSVDEQFAVAFRAWGADVDRLPTERAAALFRKRPSRILTEVVAALDEWTSERRQQQKEMEAQIPAALAEALDEEPGSKRRELRAMLARGSLRRENALATLALALRPVPVPYDAGWGQDRVRLRALVAKTDPATEPALGLVTLVRALVEAGNDDLAEELLRAALRARPQEVVLYNQLGALLRRQHRRQEAVEVYAALRGIRPELGLNLADALIASGRDKEGFALYERLRKERGDDPWMTIRHANALSRRDRDKEAENAYRVAIRLQPDHAATHNNLGLSLMAQGRYKEAETSCRKAIRLNPGDAGMHNSLGSALLAQGQHKEAETAYRVAIGLKGADAGMHNNLGVVLTAQGRYKEAEAAWRKALRLKPDDAATHSYLGWTLAKQRRYKEAEAAWREASRLKPDDAGKHDNLGFALMAQGRFKEAEAAYRVAIGLKPDDAGLHKQLGNALGYQRRYKEAEDSYRKTLQLKADDAGAYNNLALTLMAQGRLKEAEAAWREAIHLKPHDAEMHNQLGHTLTALGLYKEAEAAYQAAIRIHPDDAVAHYNLAIALTKQGRHKEAEGAYREAIRRKHHYPRAHNNLGVLLANQGRHKEAEAAYRVAIQQDPQDPGAHNNLGAALLAQGRDKEAEAAFRRTIRLNPEHAGATCGLGHALQAQGLFRNALRAFRKGHELGSLRPGWSHPSGLWVGRCRRLVTLDRLLCKVLDGTGEPANAAERLELAALCQMPCKRLHRTAVHLVMEAFVAEPTLADRHQEMRYNAARSAVLAADGQAEDAKVLPDRVVCSLRRQALSWLRAELVKSHDVRAVEQVRQRLQRCLHDPALASVRGKEALGRLPEPERQAWQQFWADVNRTIRGGVGVSADR